MFLIVGACPVRHYCFSNIWFIFKGRIVYSLSLCIHNHLTSIRFSSGDLVGKNTKFILCDGISVWFLLLSWICVLMYIIQYKKYLLDRGIIFSVYTFDEIQKLISRFIFVAVCIHFVVSMIIDTKCIENSFYLLYFFCLRLYWTPWWTAICLCCCCWSFLILI